MMMKMSMITMTSSADLMSRTSTNAGIHFTQYAKQFDDVNDRCHANLILRGLVLTTEKVSCKVYCCDNIKFLVNILVVF